MKKIFSIICFFLIFFFFTFSYCFADENDLYSIYGAQKNYQVNDPFENYNKKVFYFNVKFNRNIIKRKKANIFKRERKITSASSKKKFFLSFKTGMFNFFNHLYGPSNTINFLLQKNPEKSLKAFWRFVINTTFGFGGFVDVAKLFDLKNERAGYEQTLSKYGAKSGPYIVFPFIGSSTARTITTDILEIMTNPLFLLVKNKLVVFTIYNYNIISSYADYYELIFENNVDTYARVRSLYLQNKTFD